ncbi:protein of unknown function [Candidatus Promineifilum breve]|uniref:Uncharacterized protein n=1 Tax=Candidatus Promineifilum breve TaxID=1806508 RepID=A0A170PGT7_9CHLR|nr:protein of unknown function [Candidatus Promineifilum breve]
MGKEEYEPQITQITQILRKFLNLRNLRNLWIPFLLRGQEMFVFGEGAALLP